MSSQESDQPTGIKRQDPRAPWGVVPPHAKPRNRLAGLGQRIKQRKVLVRQQRAWGRGKDALGGRWRGPGSRASWGSPVTHFL